jgi:hypothetical protein
MYFEVVPPEEENKLAQILRKITGGALPPAAQHVARPQPSSAPVERPQPSSAPVERPQPSSAPVRITREAAPEILAKIIERINAKGVVTRQELVEIVKATNK